MTGQTSRDTDLNLPQNNYINLGMGIVNDATTLSQRVYDLFQHPSNINSPIIRIGDYTSIESNPIHGLVVIGW